MQSIKKQFGRIVPSQAQFVAHPTRPLDAPVRPTYKVLRTASPINHNTTTHLCRPVRKRSKKTRVPIALRRRRTSRCYSPSVPIPKPLSSLARGGEKGSCGSGGAAAREGRRGDQRWRRGRRPRTSSPCGAPPP
jgi:hypothetical protein